jgi:Zn-dependent M28 family amino/carboxypeptidase
VLCVLAPALAATAAMTVPLRFDGGRAYEDIRQLVAIGPRAAGSPGIEQARKYLTQQLSAIGVKVVEQPFDADTPLGRVHMVNVVATLPGDRAERIAFAGHYDTKLFRGFRFVGANDGGSSAAFLLELARALRHRHNPFSIDLLFFDGEEAVVEWSGTDHTYGSRHYVEQAKQAGTLNRLKALVLVDMIGDRDLRIRREQSSTRWLTDLIWTSAQRLNLDRYFVPDATPIEDDHRPFLDAGVAAVDVIDLEYPPWHTADDTLDHVSARSLEVIGEVLLSALPEIEKHLQTVPQRSSARDLR